MLNILKYTLGILLAIAILAGSGFAVALYLMNRTSILPEKPVFSNDQPSPQANTPKQKVNKSTSASPSPEENTTKATPSPTPTSNSDAEESAEEALPPGAYQARVTWPQGLSIRGSADTNAERVGGVAFNSKVVVLEESPDKAWQKIRIDGSNQEGWIKSGNTKAIDE